MRALIAEPQPDEAIRLAAFLQDDGFDVTIFSGADLVQDVTQAPPQVLVLRHERPGASGLALVSRVKQVAPGTVLILTTSELTSEAIAQSRQQRYHPDAYLHMPVERAALLEAARVAPPAPTHDTSTDTEPSQPEPAQPEPAPPGSVQAGAANASADHEPSTSGSAEAVPSTPPSGASSSPSMPPEAAVPPASPPDAPASSWQNEVAASPAAPSAEGAQPSPAPSSAGVLLPEAAPPVEAAAPQAQLADAPRSPTSAAAAPSAAPASSSGLPRAVSGLPRASSRPSSEGGLSADDQAFVERVFATVQNVDLDAQVTDPPAPATLDPTERKVTLLRSELRRRERELARLSKVWRVRDDDIKQKEARSAQKDIELESARLKAQDLAGTLEQARQQAASREAALGRELGDMFDAHVKEQAGIIQHVAGKERALHVQSEKARAAQEAAAQERARFEAKLVEWERALADVEAQHRKVIDASKVEVLRLEEQIRAREAAHQATRARLRDRELDLEVARSQRAQVERTLRHTQHAAATTEATMAARAHALLVEERRGARLASEEAALLRARVLDLELDLERHQRLLMQLDADRRRALLAVGMTARAGDEDRARLLDERAMWVSRVQTLEGALSDACALGEATANQLFQLEEKRRVVGAVQVAVRDAKLADLTADAERLSRTLAEATERLGQVEMDHAAEQARAEELDRALVETTENLRVTEEQLTASLTAVTVERDQLFESLALSEKTAALIRDEFAQARTKHEERESELTGMVEERDTELAARAERLVEFERSLETTTEDLHNARKTITVRDERIAELQARVRSADEQNAALEAQNFRLTTESAEKDADLQARIERIESLQQRIAQRDADNERLELDLRKAQGAVLEKTGLAERLDGQLQILHADLAHERDEVAQLKAGLEQRGTELMQAGEREAELTRQLHGARAEVAAGEVVAEQLRAQLANLEQRGADLRRVLEGTEARLRQAQADVQAGGQRIAALDIEIEELRAQASLATQELEAARAEVAELTWHRGDLTENVARLQEALGAEERAKQALDMTLAEAHRDSAELNAALDDARARIDELGERVRGLEDVVEERDAVVAQQARSIEEATARDLQQTEDMAARDAELNELRQRLDDTASAIEERGRWLQTRDATIAQLKASLESEHSARAQLSAKAHELEQQCAGAFQERDVLMARLDEADAQRAAEEHRTAQQLSELADRADRAEARVRELEESVGQSARELSVLRVDAQRAAELQAAEEKVRADALKMRQLAERAAQELKTMRASAEKAEAEAVRLRSELEGARSAQKASEQQVMASRQEGEQRAARMRDLEQQQQRLQAARDALERRAVEAEREAHEARAQAEQRAVGERGALEDQLSRLQAELAAARKERADALAAAQLAKSETEQIKRHAAEKIKQAQAMARPSSPPRPAIGSTVPSPASSSPSPEGASVPPTAASGVRPPSSPPMPAPVVSVVSAAGSTTSTSAGRPEPNPLVPTTEGAAPTVVFDVSTFRQGLASPPPSPAPPPAAAPRAAPPAPAAAPPSKAAPWASVASAASAAKTGSTKVMPAGVSLPAGDPVDEQDEGALVEDTGVGEKTVVVMAPPTGPRRDRT